MVSGGLLLVASIAIRCPRLTPNGLASHPPVTLAYLPLRPVTVLLDALWLAYYHPGAVGALAWPGLAWRPGVLVAWPGVLASWCPGLLQNTLVTCYIAIGYTGVYFMLLVC